MSTPTVSTDALLPYVLPYAPGCPNLVATPAIRHAAVDLCVHGKVWRHVFSYALTANNLPAPIPDNSALLKIEAAYLDGQQLQPEISANLMDFIAGSSPAGNRAEKICVVDDDLIHVFPEATGTLKMSVLLKPKQGITYSAATAFLDASNVIPAFMVTHHAETLAAGALSRILLMPGQPFTNVEAAAFFMNKFRQDCDALSASSIHKQTGAPLRTKPSYI